MIRKKRGKNRVNQDCLNYARGVPCKTLPCRYNHGKDGSGGSLPQKTVTLQCLENTGKCSYGDRCRFEHSESRSRQVAEEKPSEEQPESEKAPQQGATRICAVEESPEADPPVSSDTPAKIASAHFVRTRSVREGDEKQPVTDCSNGPRAPTLSDCLCQAPTSFGETQRRSSPQDKLEDFESERYELPIRPRPPLGYAWSSLLNPAGLEHVSDASIRVIWDGGAEGVSISDKCASRLLHAQSAAGIPHKNCPLRHNGRLEPAQKFYGYDEGKGQGTAVWFIADLYMSTPEGVEFPLVEVRMVPGQVDDLLIAAPVLDEWGFDPFTDPEQFLFRYLDVAVEREIKSSADPTTIRAVETDPYPSDLYALIDSSARGTLISSYCETYTSKLPGNSGTASPTLCAQCRGFVFTSCNDLHSRSMQLIQS